MQQQVAFSSEHLIIETQIRDLHPKKDNEHPWLTSHKSPPISISLPPSPSPSPPPPRNGSAHYAFSLIPCLACLVVVFRGAWRSCLSAYHLGVDWSAGVPCHTESHDKRFYYRCRYHAHHSRGGARGQHIVSIWLFICRLVE